MGVLIIVLIFDFKKVIWIIWKIKKKKKHYLRVVEVVLLLKVIVINNVQSNIDALP